MHSIGKSLPRKTQEDRRAAAQSNVQLAVRIEKIRAIYEQLQTQTLRRCTKKMKLIIETEAMKREQTELEKQPLEPMESLSPEKPKAPKTKTKENKKAEKKGKKGSDRQRLGGKVKEEGTPLRTCLRRAHLLLAAATCAYFLQRGLLGVLHGVSGNDPGEEGASQRQR